MINKDYYQTFNIVIVYSIIAFITYLVSNPLGGLLTFTISSGMLFLLRSNRVSFISFVCGLFATLYYLNYY